MPAKLYDKDQILEICQHVFALHGYEKTSTVMLAKAAGVSRALLFHHFRNKKELYLEIVDRSLAKGRQELETANLSGYQDFFEAREKFSRLKFNFFQTNPDAYRILKEALVETPEAIIKEVKERYGKLQTGLNKLWKDLFNKVSLKSGVDRGQAFRLVMLVLDDFDRKYISEATENDVLNRSYFQRFLKERNSFLAMVRYGIQSQGEN
ncbi:TetR/AcrR family transcriptional regulator [Thermoactinomyces mirandus]|uniref:TetR/AcrR family transcriptional regulator n=1 Tax=Thermoactinomyces mirandus TaxID=2756294 RepID=A0A7W1XPT4_9BACL|nr:TetR/AcrR family transcriptional regulator [Thermoactinomyces mirandus]MBA4600790.1 TetR/AcrR family transcriptional regulator [Thermoactinomyces mirandus]